MAAVEAQGLNLYYGSNHAVQDMNMTIPKGAIFGLIGPNGSGKSTTMNMITTLLAPSSGSLKVMGHDVNEAGDAVRRNIGLAPEEPALFSGLSAREFVRLSAVMHELPDDEAEKRIQHLLETFELRDKADDQLGSFSKGMKRKAMICAALVHDPALLVMDEALDGLDVFAQKILKEELRRRAANGTTIIYSTHILETIDGFCSHVGLLEKGKVLDFGGIDEVRKRLGITHLGDAFKRAEV